MIPRKYRFAIPVLCLLSSCRLFDYSPYQIPHNGEGRGLTYSNITRIGKDQAANGDGFTIAVLSDPQLDYDQLAAAVRHINTDTSIRFAVIAGDLTQFGLLREFQWMAGALSGLSVPYFTVLGNHDAQANGTEIYLRMFGPLNYSFTYRGAKFIYLNDNVWEYTCCAPDLAWLETELAAAGDTLGLFVVSHIPPFGDQFNGSLSKSMMNLLEKYGVKLSVHGHQHNYHFHPLEGGKVPYLVADNIGDRNYVKVSVSENGLSVERVFF